MKPHDLIETLLSDHSLISDQVDYHELAVVLKELQQSLSQAGVVVEFGCYMGTTSLFIRRLLDALREVRAFHVYDSFEGLPEKTTQDQSPVGEQFKAGELAASKKQFIQAFTKAHLALPVIHKGWFSQLSVDDVPQSIVFAFLDGDYYDSIRDSLHLIETKLAPQATIVVDDYANEALPGAAQAVDEWCHAKGYRVQVIHSLAVIHCKTLV